MRFVSEYYNYDNSKEKKAAAQLPFCLLTIFMDMGTGKYPG
jgi:hypothetical protein